MKIYSCDWPVPFPSSEYGGLVIVAASSVEEATKLVMDSVSDYDKEHYPDMTVEFTVLGTSTEPVPCILEMFTT